MSFPVNSNQLPVYTVSPTNYSRRCLAAASRSMIASQQSTDNAQKIKYPAHHSSIRLGHYVYWLTFVTVLTLAATAATEASAQGTAKCYFFGPGITIPGAEYRRDYGLSQNQCARVCKSDACCMAFEWQKDLSICTLKARSLNGTVTAIGGNVYFGLCLDYADSERDRLWDHEIDGKMLVSKQDVEREQCATYCKTSLDEAAAASEATTGDNPHHPNHHPLKKNFFPQQPISRARRNEKAKVPVVMYNWHSDDPQDMDTQTGRCHCISVLHSVKLSFGSFSGFQLS